MRPLAISTAPITAMLPEIVELNTILQYSSDPNSGGGIGGICIYGDHTQITPAIPPNMNINPKIILKLINRSIFYLQINKFLVNKLWIAPTVKPKWKKGILLHIPRIRYHTSRLGTALNASIEILPNTTSQNEPILDTIKILRCEP